MRLFGTCAMKMAATASYKAVPSMLIVAPMGRTNLEGIQKILTITLKTGSHN